MNLVELVIDENEQDGIEAISTVLNPAIEEDFLKLKKHNQVEFKQINKEKRILLGALLIPNKPIFRKNGNDEYYVYFSKDTVRKASQMYLTNGNQNNFTMEHENSIKGLTLVESWIVEDVNKDKSKLYNLNVPLGTWVGAVKVNDDDIWENYIKTGKVKGFSIEGYFSNKADVKKNDTDLSKEDIEYWNKILNTLENE